MDKITVTNLNFKNIIKYPDLVFEDRLTCICGKSGCGKSTLLKMINRLIEPIEGTIEYNDNNIKKLNVLDYRKEVMLVSQSPLIFEGDINNNFDYIYELRKIEKLNDKEKKHYMSLCLLDKSLDEDTQHLSGGEKQRLFLSICISLKPKFLLLDEPTSALDERSSDELIYNLKRLAINEDMQIIMISHNKVLANKYADKIIELGDDKNA